MIKHGVEIDVARHTKADIFSYALKGDADFSTENLQLDSEAGCYRFGIRTPEGMISNCVMHYPGLLNVENACGSGCTGISGWRFTE